jgi:hypothetical protein
MRRIADHSGREVKGMNCLRPLKHWDRGFESHSRHECLYCMRLFCACAVLCVPCDVTIPRPRSPPDYVNDQEIEKLRRSNKKKKLYSHR